MATLEGILRDPIKRPFRKAEIKRRSATTGLYETSWVDITRYVTKWGTMQVSLDDQRLNQFNHSGVVLGVRNDYGEFDPEYEKQSLFNGYLTRYRTILRIQAGYTDGSGNQFPTDPTHGIFVLGGEIVHTPNSNNINLNFKSIISVFQEVRAHEIGGIYTANLTGSDIIGKVRDATDGAGNYLFREFITSTAWSIASTTNIFNALNTSTILEPYSVWELMNLIAEAENYVLYVTRTGGLVFDRRQPNTTASQFSFYGAGFDRPNVIKINSYKEAINKFYTHFRFKYLEPATTTSYIEAGTSTVLAATSREWQYGRRTYEFENPFFSDTATAQNVVSQLYNQSRNLRNELLLDAIFTPQLELQDRVDVSYREGSIDSIQLWDQRDWAADTFTSDTAIALTWASETSASLEFYQKSFRILSRQTNLDTFVTTFNLREAET